MLTPFPASASRPVQRCALSCPASSVSYNWQLLVFLVGYDLELLEWSEFHRVLLHSRLSDSASRLDRGVDLGEDDHRGGGSSRPTLAGLPGWSWGH